MTSTLHHYLCFCKPTGIEKMASDLYTGPHFPRGFILMDWHATDGEVVNYDLLDYWQGVYALDEYFFEPSAEARLMLFLRTGDLAYLYTRPGETQTIPSLPPSLMPDLSFEPGILDEPFPPI